jgi:hypothetical protein
MVALLVVTVAAGESGRVQTPFTAQQLADYRLTVPVFRQFVQASRLIAAATRSDPKFERAPLFTREVAVSGDAPAAAAELEARLKGEPALADALRAAKLTAREYTTFALALLAARLAHGFVDAGVLRGVPAGVAADNVAFVEAHQAEIAAVFDELGISAPPAPLRSECA